MITGNNFFFEPRAFLGMGGILNLNFEEKFGGIPVMDSRKIGDYEPEVIGSTQLIFLFKTHLWFRIAGQFF